MRRVILQGLQMAMGLAMFILVGCAFMTLKEELAALDKSYSLRGRVINESPYQKEFLVLLYREEAEGKISFVHAKLPEPSGHFSYEVKVGSYYVCAFEDLNSNMVHDRGEYIGFYGSPDKVTVGKAVSREGSSPEKLNLNISISRQDDLPPEFPSEINIDAEHLSESIFRIGTVAFLDDHRFSYKNAEKGCWRPLTFLMDRLAGIYFLEEYDKNKVPILFIHGIVGTPMHWQDIVSHIDRRKFQPWLYYYPSGLPLNIIADELNILIENLHEIYAFEELVVAAHSMGGLVAKSFILKNVYRYQRDYIKLFITISTPWNGHLMAEFGAKRAPTPVPSWLDMTPGSEFIESIFAKELPPSIAYYLLFNHKGHCSRFMENNDGSVELSSQLHYKAQKHADGIFGFNAGHVDVLYYLRTCNRFEQILNQEINVRSAQGFQTSDFGIPE